MKLAINPKPFPKGSFAGCLFLMAVMVGLLQGCSIFEGKPDQIEKQPKKQAVMWKVKQNRLSEPVYLMANAYPNIRSYLTHARLFNKGIAKADTFLMPFNKPRPQIHQSLAENTKMKSGITLDSFLNAKAKSALKQTLKRVRGISYSSVKQAPPLAVAEVVIPAIAKATTNPTYARKAWALREKAYKPAIGVLNPEVLERVFKKISLKSQAQTLRKVLNRKESIKKGMRKMARAFARPNYKKIANARAQVYPYPKRYDSATSRTISGDWVEAIQKFEGTNPMLAIVEARYLVGKDGVINQLRQSGYEVKPYNPERFPDANNQQQGTN